MTGLTVIGFVLAAVLVVAGCLKADRVRALRSSLNPSASELPDSAFLLGRVIFFGLAGVLVYTGVHGLAVSDDSEWSDDELTVAVQEAVASLDGSFRLDDGVTDEGYALVLEDEIVEHGAADAPQMGVYAEPAETNQESDADYTVTASGAEKAFCIHVQRHRSKKHDWDSPGIAGGKGVTVPAFAYAVTSREGGC